MVRSKVPPRDFAATLVTFLETVKLSGELAGGIWSTRHRRVFHDDYRGVAFTKVPSERRMY